MHPATIPLAAMATFAAVYWLIPVPAAVPQAEPARIVAAEVPVSTVAEVSRSGSIPAAEPVEAPLSRPARPRVEVAAEADVARPVRLAGRAPEAEVYFSGCNEVRAAGLAPLYIGQPGYRPEMDGDDDGIACEPWRGRR